MVYYFHIIIRSIEIEAIAETEGGIGRPYRAVLKRAVIAVAARIGGGGACAFIEIPVADEARR